MDFNVNRAQQIKVKGVNMYYVEHVVDGINKVQGPFETVDAAEKWAEENSLTFWEYRIVS